MRKLLVCVRGPSAEFDRDSLRTVAGRTGLELTSWDPARRPPRGLAPDLIVASGDPVLAADLAVRLKIPLAIAPDEGAAEWLSRIDDLAFRRVGVLKVRLDRRRDRHLYGEVQVSGGSLPVTVELDRQVIETSSFRLTTCDVMGLANESDGPSMRDDEMLLRWYTAGRWSRRLLDRKSVVLCRSSRPGGELAVTGDGGRVRAVAGTVMISQGPQLMVAPRETGQGLTGR